MSQFATVGCMARPDLNLLVTLDVLLAEGSVARAARRLRLSPSAMSRQLARLRDATGDPLLVRAGRDLVPTPRALELRARVGQLVQDGQAVLRPAETLNLKRLVRTFTVRCRDGFVENFGPALIARVGKEAPGVRLLFVPKTTKDSAPLRDGTVDLDTGVVGPLDRSRGAHASLAPRPLRRRRPVEAPARSRKGHARALRRRPPHPGITARTRKRTDRRGPGAAWAGTGDRHRRRRILGSAGARPRIGPDRHSARALHRKSARGHAQLSPSVLDTGDHDFPALASAPGCRSGASLAARLCPGRLCRGAIAALDQSTCRLLIPMTGPLGSNSIVISRVRSDRPSSSVHNRLPRARSGSPWP